MPFIAIVCLRTRSLRNIYWDWIPRFYVCTEDFLYLLALCKNSQVSWSSRVLVITKVCKKLWAGINAVSKLWLLTYPLDRKESRSFGVVNLGTLNLTWQAWDRLSTHQPISIPLPMDGHFTLAAAPEGTLELFLKPFVIGRCMDYRDTSCFHSTQVCSCYVFFDPYSHALIKGASYRGSNKPNIFGSIHPRDNWF